MPDHEEADRVVTSVAEEIEGIGLERRRTCCETRRDLNGEHRNVDGKDGPKDPPVPFVPAMRVDSLVTT